MSKLTVGLDARAMSHPQHGGFKTYVTGVVNALLTSDDEYAYQIYVDRQVERPRTPMRAKSSWAIVPGGLPVLGPILREQVLLPLRATHDEVDVLHCPAGTMPLLSNIPTVITIHDAIEHLPRSLTGASLKGVGMRRRLMSAYFRVCQRAAARCADLVVTDSQQSARDLERFVGIDRSRLRVVPLAPSPTFRYLPVPKGLPDGGTPFVLGIGSADPRKNMDALLRGYAKLPSHLREGYRLGLLWTHVAQRERLHQLAADLGITQNLVSLTAPSDEDLCELYNRATVFAFPSRYEGFGLPPVEAMACGTPVIASTSGPLPEVLGDAAILVDPLSVDDLARGLERLLGDPDLRTDLSDRGREHVKRFSWRRTAAELRAIYAEVRR